MATTTPTDLAALLTDYVAKIADRDGLVYAWLSGTALGGPQGNGLYPVKDLSGFIRYLPSPEKIMGVSTNVFVSSSTMLTKASTVVINAAATMIRTSDPGNPTWKYRADADAIAALAPGAVVYDSTGRGFVLDVDVITPEIFGAKGDGITNDTTAFQRMGAFVTWQGHGQIQLKTGAVYIVGRQATQLGSSATQAYVEEQVMQFNFVKGLMIFGNGAELRNADGLHYGSFNPSTGVRYDPPQGGFGTATYRAALGHILAASDSQFITIQDLRINGNSANLVIGGYYGDKGYQLPGDCVRLTRCSMIRLANMEMVNSPHDGLYMNVLGAVNTGDAELQGSFVGENLLMDLNGRQGCSITGGSGFIFRNCRFLRSGQGAIHSPPMAGCDIEPAGRWGSDFMFEQCQFVANGGVQLIADSGQSIRVTAKRCSFWAGFAPNGTSIQQQCGHALLIDKKGWVFEDCDIHGTFSSIEPGTVFNRCSVDVAVHPIYGEPGKNQTALINSPDGSIWHDSIIEMPLGIATDHILLTSKNANNPAGPAYFSNCQFRWGGMPGYTGSTAGLAGHVFEDCQFIGLQSSRPVTRPQFAYASLPDFRGVCTVSGYVRVGNYTDGLLPTTFSPLLTGLAFQPSDDLTSNVPITQEYRASLPTTGYYKRGSVVWNTSNINGTPMLWTCIAEGAVATAPWAPGMTYAANDTVLNDNGKTYRALVGGVSTPYLDAALIQNFNNTVNGWSGSSASVASASDGMLATSTSSSARGRIASGALSFSGSRYTRVVLDMTRTVAPPAGKTSSLATLLWTTSSRSDITATPGGGVVANNKADMDNATVGQRIQVVFDVPATIGGMATDWLGNTVTQIGFYLDAAGALNGQWKIHNARIVDPASTTVANTQAGAPAAGPTGTAATIYDGEMTWRYYAAPVWQPIGYDVPGITEVASTTSTLTITPQSTNTQRWASPITAARTVNISTAGVLDGRRYRFMRALTCTGNFAININYNSVLLEALTIPGQWVEVEYDSAVSSFVIIGSGNDAPPMGPRVFPGYYTMPFAIPATSGTALGTLGAVYVCPVMIANAITVSEIGMEVTAAPTDPTAALRFGIYADEGRGFPGALLLDAGQVVNPAVGTRGAQITGLSLPLQPGLYWLAVCPQVASGISVRGNGQAPFGQEIDIGTPTNYGWRITGVTGALPASFGGTRAFTSLSPRIFIKA